MPSSVPGSEHCLDQNSIFILHLTRTFECQCQCFLEEVQPKPIMEFSLLLLIVDLYLSQLATTVVEQPVPTRHGGTRYQ